MHHFNADVGVTASVSKKKNVKGQKINWKSALVLTGNCVLGVIDYILT